MLIKAYGKINIFLKVINKRDDGYHNIESVLLPIDLHDVISVTVDRVANDDFVICDDLILKYNRYNLCHKAINVAREKRNFTERFVVSIHKNLFYDAGLGGGSADAAATLLAIVKLLKIKTSIQELQKIALEIGSDVPWAITSCPAVIKERGNIIKEFNLNKEYYCLLVKPKEGLLTKKVFEVYDKEPQTEKKITGAEDVVKDLLNGKTLKEISLNIYNELEPTSITLLPQIQEIKNDLKELRFHLIQMTGSGSTVFGLTTCIKKAKRAKEYFASKDLEVELTKTISGRKLKIPTK